MTLKVFAPLFDPDRSARPLFSDSSVFSKEPNFAKALGSEEKPMEPCPADSELETIRLTVRFSSLSESCGVPYRWASCGGP